MPDLEAPMDEPDTIPPEVLASMLMRMFEFAPMAMAITTSDAATSSYAKVNDAYLRLTGLEWNDIRGKRLTSEGAAIASPARDRRHRMLDQEGCYVLEEVELMHVDGTLIPTLISAQRTVVDGVSYDVEVIVDVSSRVRMQQEMERALRRSARTDALTGLPNRAWLDEVLAARVSDRRSCGTMAALAFVDLNGFKKINDAMGHSMGDEALKVVARRMQENCRATDFVARIGGDEFAIVFDAVPRGSRSVRDRLQRLMGRVCQPIVLDGRTLMLGAAVGVSFQSAEGDSPAALLRRADECMYAAKSSGDFVKVVSTASRAPRPNPVTRLPRCADAGASRIPSQEARPRL